MKTTRLALDIWWMSSVSFGVGCLVYLLYNEPDAFFVSVIATIVALIGSLPILLILFAFLPLIRDQNISLSHKKIWLAVICIVCCALYGCIGAIIFIMTILARVQNSH